MDVFILLDAVDALLQNNAEPTAAVVQTFAKELERAKQHSTEEGVINWDRNSVTQEDVSSRVCSVYIFNVSNILVRVYVLAEYAAKIKGKSNKRNLTNIQCNLNVLLETSSNAKPQLGPTGRHTMEIGSWCILFAVYVFCMLHVSYNQAKLYLEKNSTCLFRRNFKCRVRNTSHEDSRCCRNYKNTHCGDGFGRS